MKTGTIVSAILAVGATVGLGVVFVTNASPYLKINELAKDSQGVHVVGKIVPGSLRQDAMAKQVSFQIQDETGKLDVVYTGPPQSNLATATQVVVIGSKHGEEFASQQMLVKCPSKYENQTGPTPHEDNKST